MGRAMMEGILKAGSAQAENVFGSNRSAAVLDDLQKRLGIRICLTNVDLVDSCEIIFLTVKPQVYPMVIEEVRDHVRPDQLIISPAPGFSLTKLEELFARPVKLIRAMPNTPALVGEAMTAICPNDRVSDWEFGKVRDLLKSFGRVDRVEEGWMSAVTAISGSSPAYVFVMLEAMADAAVLKGLPRHLAYPFAAQAVLGAAKMALDTGMHPGQLKDMVTSPAGTTIEAVRILEENGFRSALIEAVIACAEKSDLLG